MLRELCRQLEIKAVHVNEEYGINESRRDVAVAEALEAEGMTFTATSTNCCSSLAAC